MRLTRTWAAEEGRGEVGGTKACLEGHADVLKNISLSQFAVSATAGIEQGPHPVHSLWTFPEWIPPAVSASLC